MVQDQVLIPTIFQGWREYQKVMSSAIGLLDSAQLELRASPDLRSVREIAAHIIGARARWFYMLMGEGGEEFKELGGWDRIGTETLQAEDIISGLDATWQGMQEAIARWTTEDWEKTWPGEDGGEPEVITRHWVIWHLIEHDLHHGGEISIILGAHGVPAIEL